MTVSDRNQISPDSPGPASVPSAFTTRIWTPTIAAFPMLPGLASCSCGRSTLPLGPVSDMPNSW